MDTMAIYSEHNLQQTWIVYILQCSDNTIYTGCTSNLEDRLFRHEKARLTIQRPPFLHILNINQKLFLNN